MSINITSPGDLVCQRQTTLQTRLRGGKTKPLVFVEGTPQADSSHACTDGTENADDTSCGNDADTYGNNSSNNANAYAVT